MCIGSRVLLMLRIGVCSRNRLFPCRLHLVNPNSSIFRTRNLPFPRCGGFSTTVACLSSAVSVHQCSFVACLPSAVSVQFPTVACLSSAVSDRGLPVQCSFCPVQCSFCPVQFQNCLPRSLNCAARCRESNAWPTRRRRQSGANQSRSQSSTRHHRVPQLPLRARRRLRT